MARARLAVLISGAGTNMAALLYAAKRADCPFEIILVASNNSKAPGLRLAAAEGIATAAHSHAGLTRAAHEALLQAELVRARTDYVALAGYMRILSGDFVALWEGRMLNMHPALLPKYPGLHTHGRALEAGDTIAGCSVHIVTAGLDEGPVLAQTQVAVLPGDTAETLAARVLIAEHQLYAPTLAAFVTRDRDPQYLLSRVRALAMAQPEANEVVSHGMPCFGIVGGKKFAYVSVDHHGDGNTALLVKISGADEQALLIEHDAERYYRPAYFGDGWVGIRLDLGDTDWEAIAGWLAKSWRAVAPGRLTRMMDIADEF